MNTQAFKAFGIGIGTVALAACSREARTEEPRASTDRTDDGFNAPRTVVAAPAPVAEPGGKSAADAIAQSRCQREVRCENVGGEGKYSSVEDCIARVRAEWREDLSVRECPGGINRMQLDECLDKVRSEECSAPFDTLARVAACTTGQICEG